MLFINQIGQQKKRRSFVASPWKYFTTNQCLTGGFLFPDGRAATPMKEWDKTLKALAERVSANQPFPDRRKTEQKTQKVNIVLYMLSESY